MTGVVFWRISTILWNCFLPWYCARSCWRVTESLFCVTALVFGAYGAVLGLLSAKVVLRELQLEKYQIVIVCDRCDILGLFFAMVALHQVMLEKSWVVILCDRSGIWRVRNCWYFDFSLFFLPAQRCCWCSSDFFVPSYTHKCLPYRHLYNFCPHLLRGLHLFTICHMF